MIHCVGNSHVLSFNGMPSDRFPCFDEQQSPYFRRHWLGPTIAYNFRENHLPKVKEYLNDVPTTDTVMLIVGEVDCRWHIPYQAHNQNRSIEDITKECVDRFTPCLTDLREMGYSVIGWGTHPTTTHGHVDPPGTATHGQIFGEMSVRNSACVLWNKFLAEFCQSENIPFVSIYHHLVDENNTTKMEFFQDYCHLSNDKCTPLILAEMKLQGILYG